MKSLSIYIATFLFAGITFTQNTDDQHTIFTDVLKDCVWNGLVNYKKLKDDNRLGKYMDQLANTDPEMLSSDEDKLAFWINAYNAYTLQFVVEEYPLESINDLHWGGLYLGTLLGATVWDDEKIVIDGTKLSLNNIEHDIARKKFNEKRIHFAMVCSSVSCPSLRDEAYEGYKLDEQLNDQAIEFLRMKQKINSI
jgi:hypothetical protein